MINDECDSFQTLTFRIEFQAKFDFPIRRTDDNFHKLGRFVEEFGVGIGWTNTRNNKKRQRQDFGNICGEFIMKSFQFFRPARCRTLWFAAII